MSLGKKLKSLRKQKKKTLREVAKEIKPNITYQYLSDLESGRRKNPSNDLLKDLADYYNVNLVHLLADEKDWHKILPVQLQEFVKEENIEYLEVGLLAKEKEISPEIIKSIIDLISKAKKNKEGGREHEDRICRTRHHGSTDGRKPD